MARMADCMYQHGSAMVHGYPASLPSFHSIPLPHCACGSAGSVGSCCELRLGATGLGSGSHGTFILTASFS